MKVNRRLFVSSPSALLKNKLRIAGSARSWNEHMEGHAEILFLPQDEELGRALRMIKSNLLILQQGNVRLRGQLTLPRPQS